MMFAFRAMNTEVEITAVHGDEETIAARIAATFADAERRFSRFREDSELSALNRARGPVVVSAELFDLLGRARAYVELTEGLFDPAVGGPLAALGYDRSFAPGALDRDEPGPQPPAGRFLEVTLDPQTRSVTRPEHVHIDLGGVAKGSTIDAAALHLDTSGAIVAGGDAVLRGAGPVGDGWLVEIEDPSHPSATIATLAVANASVATSAANRRRWRVGRALAHHLIDPRTRTSAATDLLQVTVVASSTELADILAKTAFLLGATDGRRFLARQPRVGAVLVQKSAEPIFLGELDIREVGRA